jgi:hypothetical protein
MVSPELPRCPYNNCAQYQPFRAALIIYRPDPLESGVTASSIYAIYPYSLSLEAIMSEATQKDEQSQSDSFKQAASDLECDPDEAKWEDKLRKVVKQKHVEKPA